MKKFTKTICALLTAASLIFSGASVFAEDAVADEPGVDGQLLINKNFDYVDGVVTSIMKSDGGEYTSVLVEGDEGRIMNFVVTEKTYVFGGDLIEEGSKVIGFYSLLQPAVLIYPPQMNAAALGVLPDEIVTAKVGHFNEDLVSEDNMLKLNIGDETEIVAIDESDFDGELKDKDLFVIYDISTRSIPAQTTPIKVVVLPEWCAIGIVEDIIEEEAPAIVEENAVILDMEGLGVLVNGEEIGAKAYAKDGIVMVPLRAAAEALGFTVKWDGAVKGVTLNEVISLRIGQAECTGLSGGNIVLPQAPILKNDQTFVPLEFFAEATGIGLASFYNLEVLLDN